MRMLLLLGMLGETNRKLQTKQQILRLGRSRDKSRVKETDTPLTRFIAEGDATKTICSFLPNIGSTKYGLFCPVCISRSITTKRVPSHLQFPLSLNVSLDNHKIAQRFMKSLQDGARLPLEKQYN